MPRKSQEALMSVAGSVSAHVQQEMVTEGLENFELPQSLVTSIARSALPPKAKMSKDTVLALLKGSTAFITLLSRSAQEIAAGKQHKNITSTDVLKALESLELGDMLEDVQEELQAYRENVKTQSTNSCRSSVGSSVSAPLPSIRIKPPRAPEEDAAEQWNAHLKMYNRKGKAPLAQEAIDSDVQMFSDVGGE